jgi:hypothetical protein
MELFWDRRKRGADKKLGQKKRRQ